MKRLKDFSALQSVTSSKFDFFGFCTQSKAICDKFMHTKDEYEFVMIADELYLLQWIAYKKNNEDTSVFVMRKFDSDKYISDWSNDRLSKNIMTYTESKVSYFMSYGDMMREFMIARRPDICKKKS